MATYVKHYAYIDSHLIHKEPFNVATIIIPI